MLELFVWLILACLLTLTALVGRYWFHLFRSQDRYTRDEIFRFATILKEETSRITGGANNPYHLAALLFGLLLGWILTLMGGLVSPDLSLIPDFAENHLPNYFFQSVLILPLIQLAWPLLKDLVRGRPPSPFSRFLGAELSFLFGTTVSLAAVNIMVWGIHHQMSFLYALFNTVSGMGYLFYRLASPPEEEAPYGSYDEEEEYGETDEEGFEETDDLHDFGSQTPVPASSFATEETFSAPSVLEEDLMDFSPDLSDIPDFSDDSQTGFEDAAFGGEEFGSADFGEEAPGKEDPLAELTGGSSAESSDLLDDDLLDFDSLGEEEKKA